MKIIFLKSIIKTIKIFLYFNFNHENYNMD